MKCLLLLLCLFTQLHAQELAVIGYNVESGDAQPAVVAEVIADIQGVDIWGLTEVQDVQWARQFNQAAAEGEGGSKFRYVLGTTGSKWGDFMAVIYDDDRFEMIGGKVELHHINIREKVRAPLVVHLRERESGFEFLFMVNHLYRGDEAGRHQQARLLNEWARKQELPVIAAGDYNFDWDVEDGENNRDEGYDHMVADDIFSWVRPHTLIRTQFGSDRYNSVLDFVFVAGDAKNWRATSEIIVIEGDEPDDASKSDHRPVRADFIVNAKQP